MKAKTSPTPFIILLPPKYKFSYHNKCVDRQKKSCKINKDIDGLEKKEILTGN